jgi:multidrug transporter EmrE-like cation transporter
MKFAEFFLILAAVVLNAIAQLFLKAGATRIGHIDFALSNTWSMLIKMVSNAPILSGLTCYVISVVIWIMALSRVEVSIAYPMLSIGYVINAALAWALFGEAVGMQRLAGIAVIIVGVIIVARS